MDAHRSEPLQAQSNRRGSDTQTQPEAHVQRSSAAQGQACQRCRQQKLRCSRESPKCTRCQRAAAICTYPPPPDRKLLAAQRVRRSRFRPYQEPRSSAAPLEQGDRPNIPDGSANQRSSSPAEPLPDRNQGLNPPLAEDFQHHRPWANPGSPSLFHLHDSATSKVTPAPSSEVARLLIEMYFTRVYNASLLFHKETFLSDYTTNKLPDCMTHAVFALASIFLPTPSKDFRIDENETELGISALSASNFTDYAQEWATIATRQVLMQATEPDLLSIQACQVLALYWFSKEARDHAHILTHLAYTSCRLLGFHVPKAEIPYGGELSAERERRCLWSCWMTACISQENASFKSESWSDVAGLPFPADEASFAAGKPESVQAFNEFGKVVPYNESNRVVQTSIMGEFVKLFSLWWQIQRFVRRYQDGNSSNMTDKLQEFLNLDRRLEIISENLHSDFKYSAPSSFTSPKLDPYMLFSVQCLYRLCACALHSSLVPLFSSSPSDPEISKKLIRMCAEEAVKHSVITLDMATAFLSIRPDKSRLSSMTGYALFVSSAIQVRSLGAQGKLKTHADHLKAAISILKDLNQYWVPLRSLWTKLWIVSSSAGLDINNFAVSRNNPQVPRADIQTDIEQIVSPEAVSESGPGADLYTYVERSEPRIRSQQSSPANTGPQITETGLALASPKNGHSTIWGSHTSPGRRATIGQASSVQGGPGDAVTIATFPSFAPAYPQASQNPPSEQPLHGQLDQLHETGTHNMPRLAEITQQQSTGNNSNMQIYDTTTILQDQGSAFRPMIDGFDTINGMMGINMELNNDDDDFWWTRSWESVRII